MATEVFRRQMAANVPLSDINTAHDAGDIPPQKFQEGKEQIPLETQGNNEHEAGDVPSHRQSQLKQQMSSDVVMQESDIEEEDKLYHISLQPMRQISTEVTRNENSKEEEEDKLHQKALELREQSLLPLKEDLADWLCKTLGIDISVDNFMDVLDNGVCLCKLAQLVQRKAQEAVQQGIVDEELPNMKLCCNERATSGSWFARDNMANFLNWCKAFGMQDDCIFETEDLVSHKSERQVVICLLELARIGYMFGLEPPSLIKMEKEIEREEVQEVPEILPKPVEIKRSVQSARTRPLNLDEEVRKVAFKCKCHEHVKKLREGTYLIFGKVVFIRLLKNRHLMVRVGGGWNTLEDYLVHHNPVTVTEHKRRQSYNALEDDLDDKYLHIRAKYKK
ncbi:hypothetical protein ACJMK2_028837 [Sinanodonta woodiana]|uniref:Uncharacterized protein n=1 Tax=Sinanodonta woodiana TaxID=1069815 RepID=A0ABD3X8R4_SINWO